MKKIIFFTILIVIMLNLNISEKYTNENSIRFRIIPNSNETKDILIKEQIFNNIQPDIEKINSSSNINKTREIIVNSLDNLDSTIKNTMLENNYDKEFSVNYGLNYFPEKEYNGITYNEGYYESLVIKIGDAKGDNFWCIMFPPLCFLEAKENDEKVEYKFFITKIINKLFGL